MLVTMMLRGFVLPLLLSCTFLTTTVSSQQCNITPEPFDFDALWIFQLAGRPDVSEFSRLVVEAGIMQSFNCADDDSGGFYALTNVTIRLDLLDAVVAGFDSENDDDMMSSRGLTAWPIAVQGLSNLVSLQNANELLHSPPSVRKQRRAQKQQEEQGDDVSSSSSGMSSSIASPPPPPPQKVRKRTLQTDCTCPVPSKFDFIENLVTLLDSNPIFSVDFADKLQNIVEMEETECASANVTEFTSSIAMDVVGNVDAVSDESLEVYARGIIDSWNTLNSLQACDVTFSRLTEGTASVDLRSIRRGAGGAGRPGSPSSSRNIRRLQDLRMLNNNDTMSFNVTEDDNMSMTTSSNETSTDPPSMAPSSTFLPSENPTNAPTSRGPDLFTLFVSLTGRCRGCEANNNLFLEVIDTRRELLMKEEEEKQQMYPDKELENTPIGSVGFDHHVRGLSFRNFSPDNCFCPIGASTARPTRDAFVEALRVEAEVLGDRLPFLDDSIRVKQVESFPCNQTEFRSYAYIGFTGDPDELTNRGIGVVENLVQTSFNNRAQQVCDPLFRSLDAVKALRVVLETDMPSMAPTVLPSESPSLFPTVSPSGTPTGSPSDSPTGAPSASNSDLPVSMMTSSPSASSSAASSSGLRRNLASERSLVQVEKRRLQNSTAEPSASPMSLQPALSSSSLPSGAPLQNSTAEPVLSPSSFPSTSPSNTTIATTNAPTGSPTSRGPDLFFLLFELTGTCNGCASDSNLFDQTSSPPGRRKALSVVGADGSWTGLTRFLVEARDGQEEDVCGCAPGTRQEGVKVEEFFEEFSMEVEEREVVGIEKAAEADELETLPPIWAPTISPMPSSEPSQMPTLSTMPSVSSMPTSNATVDLASINSTFVPSFSDSNSTFDPSFLNETMAPSFGGSDSTFDPTFNGTATAFPSNETIAPSFGGSDSSTFDPTFNGTATEFPSNETIAPSFGGSASSTFDPTLSDTTTEIPSSAPSSSPPMADSNSVPDSSLTTNATIAPTTQETATDAPSNGDDSTIDPSTFDPTMGVSTSQPSAFPSEMPTAFPTSSPTSTPTSNPTLSSHPSASPSGIPSAPPTQAPQTQVPGSPTGLPSVSPSLAPTRSPSTSPSVSPSVTPSSTPSGSPTASPTLAPSGSPSTSPSSTPSGSPSTSPSPGPTRMPTPMPSTSPSSAPSTSPSTFPTESPSGTPSMMPSVTPTTTSPTALPTLDPTVSPSAPSMSPTMQPTICQDNEACWDYPLDSTLSVLGSPNKINVCSEPPPSPTGARLYHDSDGFIELFVQCCTAGVIRVIKGCFPSEQEVAFVRIAESLSDGGNGGGEANNVVTNTICASSTNATTSPPLFVLDFPVVANTPYFVFRDIDLCLA